MSQPESSGRSTDDRWRSYAGPLGAAVVLILGVGLLFFRGTGDAEVTSAPDDERTTEPDTTRETNEPEINSTVPDSGAPRPTPPPLFEPTTVPVGSPTLPPPITPDATTTSPIPPKTTPPPATTSPPTSNGGPSITEVRSALVELGDIDNVNWRLDTLVEVADPCGENPDLDSATHNETVLFSRIQVDPIALRQLSNRIVSFPDATTAERAYTAGIDILETCDGESIDINGDFYDLSVEVDSFTASEAASFRCADDISVTIAELTNPSVDVPYIGDVTASFRCGRNVTIVSFTTTVDFDDLDDADFFAALSAANIDTAGLPGS